jgi:hypothetical protein
MHVASCRQHLVGALEHHSLGFFIRQDKRAELLPPIKRRTLLDRQPIHGDMRGGKGDGLLEARLPGRQRLPRQAKHEIKVQVQKSRPSGPNECNASLCGRVQAVECGKQVIVESLHP